MKYFFYYAHMSVFFYVEKRMGRSVLYGYGMAFGALLGLLIGIFLNQLTYGLIFGASIGFIIGVIYYKKKEE